MLGIIAVLFHFYVLVIHPISYWRLYLMHILFGMLLVYAIYKPGKKFKDTVPWYDVLLMLAGIGTVIYCITAERGMAYRMGSNPTTADLIAISIILLLLLEGTRRIYGMILPRSPSYFCFTATSANTSAAVSATAATAGKRRSATCSATRLSLALR